jgi:hypothetical protein
MNALLESCKKFAWSFSLCILLLESKIKDEKKMLDAKAQQCACN